MQRPRGRPLWEAGAGGRKGQVWSGIGLDPRGLRGAVSKEEGWPVGVSFAKPLGALGTVRVQEGARRHCGPAAGHTAPQASRREVDRAVSRGTSQGVGVGREERALRASGRVLGDLKVLNGPGKPRGSAQGLALNLFNEGAIPAKPVRDVPPRREGRLSLSGRAEPGQQGCWRQPLSLPPGHRPGLSRPSLLGALRA